MSIPFADKQYHTKPLRAIKSQTVIFAKPEDVKRYEDLGFINTGEKTGFNTVKMIDKNGETVI